MNRQSGQTLQIMCTYILFIRSQDAISCEKLVGQLVFEHLSAGQLHVMLFKISLAFSSSFFITHLCQRKLCSAELLLLVLLMNRRKQIVRKNSLCQCLDCITYYSMIVVLIKVNFVITFVICQNLYLMSCLHTQKPSTVPNLRADEKVWYVGTILKISRKCSKMQFCGHHF